jgi:DNA invertase Pin-like site-specific DNA recombinase
MNGESKAMRALIYTRQSTDSQDNTRSTQEHDCSAWATSEGYEIAGSYHDEISGGVAPCERPSFCAMLDQLQEGDVIVAWRRDRIGRDLVENAVAHKLVERKGAKIITLDAPKDDTAESVMIRQMLDVIAQYERAIISMRTKCALADRRRRGLVAGTPELGTQATEDGRIVPDTEETAKINAVRSWRAEGLTYAEIQDRCAEQGVTSRSGSTPAIRTIREWTKGIERPRRQRRAKPARSAAKQRIEARDTNRGMTEIILTMKDAGKSFQAITNRINEIGYRTSKGGEIGKTQIFRIYKHLMSGGDPAMN